MSLLLQDLRYGARSLANSWGFTAIAVGMLALGIGATTTVFSLGSALLLRPLNGGTSDDASLVRLYGRTRAEGGSWRRFSYPDFEDIHARRDLFESLVVETLETVGIAEGTSTRRVFASFVSSDYFPMLRARMALGRAFTPADDEPGAPPVAVVSHPFWVSRGRDPHLVGQAIAIDGRVTTIVGVAPEAFTGTMAVIAPLVWLPISQIEGLTFLASNGEQRRAALTDRGNHQFNVVGRLAPGLTIKSAAPRLEALSLAMERSYPAVNRDLSLVLTPHSPMSTSASPVRGADPFAVTVSFAFAMAAALLLVAALNLANMLLARGGLRQREIAVRLAVGASRWGIVRLLLAETTLLSLAGGALGVGLAIGASQSVAAMARSLLPMAGIVFDPLPDWRVLAATLGFCALATLVFGLGPALTLSRPDVAVSLTERAGSQAAGRGRGALRHGLVVAQIALSLALLTAGGLFAFGAWRAGAADPGFRLEGGLAASLDASLAGYGEARTRQAFARVLERVRSTPGVLAASLAHTTPYGERNFDRLVQAAGAPPGARRIDAQYRVIGADYFKTLGVAVVRGREFTAAEEASPSTTHPVIVDTEFARRMWPGQDPIGRQIQWAEDAGQPSRTVFEVVGLAASLKVKLFDRAPRAHVYVPFGDNYQPAVYVHMRTASGGPQAEAVVLQAAGAAIRAADPELPVVAVRTLRDLRDAGFEVWFVRLAARVFAVLGLIALVVAAVGLYGVRAFLVGRRTREFGVRVALGATTGDVMRLVLSEGAKLVAAGLALGLLLSAGVSRVVAGWVYGVRSFEPAVFATTALVLSVAMFVACYVPARRATTVAPAAALRSE